MQIYINIYFVPSEVVRKPAETTEMNNWKYRVNTNYPYLESRASLV